MNNIYLLNEKVRFISDQHRLEPVDDQGPPIALNVPASRCLLLLLQRQGEVISQKEFLYEVWESKGQFANANTYFQNIYLLRRALKIAGIEEIMIKTIPKEGLMFIGKCALIEEDGPEPLNENADVNLSTSTLASPAHSVLPEKPANSTPKKFIAWKTRYPLKKIALAGLLMVAILSSFMAYQDIKRDTDFFADYVAIGDVNQCTVYSNKKYVLRAKHEYVNFFVKKNITCEPGQVAYIAINPEAIRVLIHICDKSINNSASCLTKFYFEPKNEK
ncbi:transcriptional regulator [Serratia sp. NPDC078593]|uniref:winged helix-turn-helix domain-containing protein n=1 Tax=unclassified Serratia (in: enterobacteria) TaxID=2647522 RepID=UPI0037D29A7D